MVPFGEVSVVEGELALEGTIRHAAAALQHLEHAIQDCFERHRPPIRCSG
jgi:hypothetical protein